MNRTRFPIVASLINGLRGCSWTPLLASSLGALLATPSFGQTAAFTTLLKTGHYEQTGASTVTFAASNLEMNISGASGVTSASFVVPSNALAGQTETLTMSGGGSHFHFGSAPYPNGGATTMDYGAGAYNLSINGSGTPANVATFGFSASNFTFTPAAPVTSTSAGTWSGGVLLVDPTQALTINSGTFTPGDYVSGHAVINITLQGGSLGLQQASIAGLNTSGYNYDTDHLSLNVPAFSMTAGTTYDVTVAYYSLVDTNTTNLSNLGNPSTILGGTAIVALGRDTHFTIQAIPEPSTYAAIFGTGAFGFAAWCRRKLKR